MIWNSPWFGIGLVYALLGLSLFILQREKVRQKFSAEARRKSLHVVMGLATLTFPWLFDHWWPVALLAGTTLIMLWLMRYSQALRMGIGSALHDVKRVHSHGELYFPLGVLILYLLGNHNFLLYTIPLLTLTLADAAAALVGQRYGRKFYTLLRDRRSWEGSCAFFCVTLFCTQAVLLCTNGLSGVQTLAVSLAFALSMALVEALSWSGLDNLFLPVSGFFVLTFLLLTPLPAALCLVTGSIFFILWQTGYVNIPKPNFNHNKEFTYVRSNQSYQQYPATTILHPHLWSGP